MPKKKIKGPVVYDIRFTVTQESILGQILADVQQGQYSSTIRELAVMGAAISMAHKHRAALGNLASSEYRTSPSKGNIEQPIPSPQDATTIKTETKITSQSDKGSSLTTAADPEPEIFMNFDPSVLKFKVPEH